MRVLEVRDDLRQQKPPGERRRRDRDRTRAALAELGGAEARLHQKGLGPKYVIRNEITGVRERAIAACPLNELQSQRLFQLGDVLRNRRLADPELRSRPGE